MAVALPAAAGDERQDLGEVRAAAERFVHDRLPDPESARVRAGRLDPRLRLDTCPAALEAFAVAGGRVGGNTSVGVRCPERWKVYVPVRVETPRDVLALARPMRRGALLAAGDLERVAVDTQRLQQGWFTEPEEVAGRRLARSAGAGTVLNHSLIEYVPLIESGQSVTLVAGAGGIAVRAPGKALSEGAEGDRIRVRNLSSGRIVEGVVRDGDHVEVQ